MWQGCTFWPRGLFFPPSSLKSANFLLHIFGLHPPRRPKYGQVFCTKKLSFQIWYCLTKNFWGRKFYTDQILPPWVFLLSINSSTIIPIVLALKLKSKLLKKSTVFLLWQLKLFVGKLSFPRFKVWLLHNKIQVFQSLRKFVLLFWLFLLA